MSVGLLAWVCFVVCCAEHNSRPRGWEHIMEEMARGWESKSVEAQQDEARQGAPKSRTKLSPEEAARSRERENLRLSRQRVIQQIESSQNPRHRKILEDALAELDHRLNHFEK